MTFFLTLVYAGVYLAYCINDQQFGGRSYAGLFWIGIAILMLMNTNISTTKRIINNNLLGRINKLEDEVSRNSDEYGLLDEDGNIIMFVDAKFLLPNNDTYTLSLTVKDCNELINFSRTNYYQLVSKKAAISYRYKMVGEFKRVSRIIIEDFKSTTIIEVDTEDAIENFFTMLVNCKNMILEKIDKDDTHV